MTYERTLPQAEAARTRRQNDEFWIGFPARLERAAELDRVARMAARRKSVYAQRPAGEWWPDGSEESGE